MQKRKLKNNVPKEPRNPHLLPVIQSSLLQDSRWVHWSMSHQTTVFCNLLLPSYAIFCHCTIRGILKIGKKMLCYIMHCLSQVFVIFSTHYHLALISAPPVLQENIEQWIVFEVDENWESLAPFRMLLERLITSSLLQNYFFSSSLLFRYMAWLICTDWLHGFPTAQGLQNKWRKDCISFCYFKKRKKDAL